MYPISDTVIWHAAKVGLLWKIKNFPQWLYEMLSIQNSNFITFSWNIKFLQIYKFFYLNSIYERNFPNFPDAKLMYLLYSLMWVPVFVQTEIWPYFHTLWTRETLAARCQWCIHCVPSSVHQRNHYRCREGEVCLQSGWQGPDSDTSKVYTPMCNW